MRIGVCGIGPVGDAISKCFTERYPVIQYDKYKHIGTFDELFDTDILFLALPTPFDAGTQCYNKYAIESTLERLTGYTGLIIIKSTIEPGTTERYAGMFDLDIVHNPEFLSAKTAYTDFCQQTHIVIGHPTKINQDKLNKLNKFYSDEFPNAVISSCTSSESESVKLFSNTFYALKVQFFTELYLLCQKADMDYDVIKDVMLKNGWINPQHTSVPGQDGNVSYGGMCFPKDTNALLSYCKTMGTPCSVVEAMINERNSLRND